MCGRPATTGTDRRDNLKSSGFTSGVSVLGISANFRTQLLSPATPWRSGKMPNHGRALGERKASVLLVDSSLSDHPDAFGPKVVKAVSATATGTPQSTPQSCGQHTLNHCEILLS